VGCDVENAPDGCWFRTRGEELVPGSAAGEPTSAQLSLTTGGFFATSANIQPLWRNFRTHPASDREGTRRI
jgi:hypothetical protein